MARSARVGFFAFCSPFAGDFALGDAAGVVTMHRLYRVGEGMEGMMSVHTTTVRTNVVGTARFVGTRPRKAVGAGSGDGHEGPDGGGGEEHRDAEVEQCAGWTTAEDGAAEVFPV